MRSKIARRFGLDLDHPLRRGAHPHIAAIVELQPVAVGEVLDPREVEQERRAAIGDQPQPPPVPVDKSQGYAIDRRLFRPMASRMNRNRPPHSFVLPVIETVVRRDCRVAIDIASVKEGPSLATRIKRASMKFSSHCLTASL